MVLLLDGVTRGGPLLSLPPPVTPLRIAFGVERLTQCLAAFDTSNSELKENLTESARVQV